MCGITGFCDFKKKSNKHNLINMTNKLYHRGTRNGYSFFENQNSNIGLGHRRLSILDLSTNGDQPIAHLIQYHAILTMKEKNRKMYYIGDRFYTENLPYVSNKQVDISHFKQGFSSIMFPRIGLVIRL